MNQKIFQSNGKLLITGEYLVLDGALALALPTKKGQSLTVTQSKKEGLFWSSLDENKNCWFEANIDLKSLNNKAFQQNLNDPKARLYQILCAAKELNPDFLAADNNIQVTTELDFHRDWGLGSSSTLINNVASWAMVNPYDLLQKTFGGSGYDIACAHHDAPILYHLKDKKPIVEDAPFAPNFSDQLFFIHLNQKQNTREAVKKYRSQPLNELQDKVKEISELTRSLLVVSTLNEFEYLMTQHENILSNLLGLPTVKSRLFPDYQGSIKSLGGWGGDFILATGSLKEMEYFKVKGFTTIVPYNAMIL
ncbi:GYDIA family GHMP kinase [Flavimarina sp. Hel_I_48]|uniref:GYDIA family GHMP kinase n=1 Tax=Flavimarina sp. Hel_I_48 TaxID=1392488 RepID=UPI0004DF4B42|nr:GYDIA family GHMP kinase [Flavimarina sp. Hel_I_48]